MKSPDLGRGTSFNPQIPKSQSFEFEDNKQQKSSCQKDDVFTALKQKAFS